jgi:hypothetical protein
MIPPHRRPVRPLPAADQQQLSSRQPIHRAGRRCPWSSLVSSSGHPRSSVAITSSGSTLALPIAARGAVRRPPARPLVTVRDRREPLLGAYRGYGARPRRWKQASGDRATRERSGRPAGWVSARAHGCPAESDASRPQRGMAVLAELIRSHQGASGVRPVLGGPVLAGKPRRGAAAGGAAWQPSKWDSNPPSARCACRGPGREGALTYGSPPPVVTAHARQGPAVSGAARTQRGPGPHEWLAPVPSGRGRPSALRSSATRDRSAGRARQGRYLPGEKDALWPPGRPHHDKGIGKARPGRPTDLLATLGQDPQPNGRIGRPRRSWKAR